MNCQKGNPLVVRELRSNCKRICQRSSFSIHVNEERMCFQISKDILILLLHGELLSNITSKIVMFETSCSKIDSNPWICMTVHLLKNLFNKFKKNRPNSKNSKSQSYSTSPWRIYVSNKHHKNGSKRINLLVCG